VFLHRLQSTRRLPSTGGPFTPGKARSGRDTDHPDPSSAEVKNE
jgi:hypothetical protein